MGYFEEALTFSMVVQPIKWISDSHLPKGGEKAFITGFGTTEIHKNGLSKTLKKVAVQIYTSATCALLMGNFNSKRQICGGRPLTFGHNSCKGDSGGPVVVNGLLAGLVSWGFLCSASTPAAYTRVSAFNDWIVKNMK